MRLISVGKLREPYVAEACDDFGTRLRRYESFEQLEVAASHGSDLARAMREEGERVMRAIAPGDAVWLLERGGSQLSTTELAERLRALAAAATSRLVLVVAGTYGASDELLARADFHWSLSRLTFLHEWTRALVLEQLYRAAKIARNEPYHH
ncbi:MAG: 23S rRNA (pseudouridine(1915)-N(3))-methyltransferase RlmH [Vulcanimicrobiaceae bacterium]